MDLEVVTGFVFALVGLVGIATPPMVQKVPPASPAMVLGGGLLLAAVFSVGGHAGVAPARQRGRVLRHLWR